MKFEEFLEWDMQWVVFFNVEVDLVFECCLVKKFKVKGGKLGGFDDGMVDILDGFGEGVEILVMEEDVLNFKIFKKNFKQVFDLEIFFLKNIK